MSKMHREKGARVEREIVNRHKAAGCYAERVPQSGGSAYTHNYDVDIYPWGEEEGALVCEVKAKQGAMPKTLLKQLGDADLLFLRPDGQDPFVFIPWRTWERVLRSLKGVRS